MYIPRLFRETDRSVALDFIDAYGFATLISWSNAGPAITHLPLILDRRTEGDERLLGHVARANDHWQHFDGSVPAVAIFHGPHAYISPAWYANHPSVPTWNYAVAHVHGVPSLVDDATTSAILERLVEKEEGFRDEPWVPDFPAEFLASQTRAIVGFQLPITRLETKFKLSQNKDARDREGALAGLEAAAAPGGVALATFARSYYRRASR